MSDRVLGGRYAVQDKIGTGGMAIVYRGIDQVLGRPVAIKTMLPQYASDPSFAARFKQEAQAAAALQSPYIVSVYDWGKDGDTYYIVMEYLRGIDLKSGIRKHGAQDGKKVAQIGLEIAQALKVAHSHDIIHRDIKPQNIMIQTDGTIKVMDFGIARAKNSHLTQDNSVLGTAHYVSPEQTQGKPLGPTTDIYSLGIVMYEAATGKVPFDGDDAISVAIQQVQNQPKPPSQVNPNVDPYLEAIILKCMQKEPSARYQSAEELSQALRDYMNGRTRQIPLAQPITTSTTTSVMPPIATLPQSAAKNRKKIDSRSATSELEEQKAQQESKHRKRTIIFAVLATLALVGIIVGVVNYIRSNSELRAVPNFVGLTQDQAVAQIQGSDGFWQQAPIKEEYSSTVAKGLVIDQDPDPGRNMSRGTQITLVISKGEEPAAEVTVPDLTNMTPSEAEAALTKAGLVGQAGDSVYDANIEAGKVVSQTPAANSTAKAGDVVTYQLSKGVETVDIPDISGYTQDAAKTALENAGFVANFTSVESDTVSKGVVVSYSPTGKADKGSTINVNISAGTSKIQVPDVTGQSESKARETLQNAGFAVNVTYQTSSSATPGTVISQSNSGTAKSGTTITITVALSANGGSGGTTDGPNSNNGNGSNNGN